MSGHTVSPVVALPRLKDDRHKQARQQLITIGAARAFPTCKQKSASTANRHKRTVRADLRVFTGNVGVVGHHGRRLCRATRPIATTAENWQGCPRTTESPVLGARKGIAKRRRP
jgi:hypothetical protein